MQVNQDDHLPGSSSPMDTEKAATLPRSFAFQDATAPPPKTPEPSNPHHSLFHPPTRPRYRIKRRRPGIDTSSDIASDDGQTQDHLPSIELSASDHAPAVQDEEDHQQGRLAPHCSSLPMRFSSPPHTPVAQITTDARQTLEQIRLGLKSPISRPSSVQSQLSSSSAGSSTSIDTYPSFGDSCTSPESEATEFVFATEGNQSSLAPPFELAPVTVKYKPKKPKKPSKSSSNWTTAMDEHLWLTYMNCMAHPVITPFKTLPGTVPPLGLCHFVTREAKKTWKGPRGALNTLEEEESPTFSSLDAMVIGHQGSAPPQSMSLNDLSSKTPARSASSSGKKPLHKWPKSASSTRKRLRHLCKRRPTLSPHYQRLMLARSPSPFESNARPGLGSPAMPSEKPSFSTRDMSFNLAASTASTMQPGAPVNQFGNDDEPGPSAPGNYSNVHQKSQSLQFELGIGNNRPARRLDYGELASPFQPEEKEDEEMPPPKFHSPHLQAPLELHHPRPMSGSMKRRAQYPLGEEMLSENADTRRDVLEQLFQGEGMASGKRRVRSRGFSMGAMGRSNPPSRHVSDLFANPPAVGTDGRLTGYHEFNFQPPPPNGYPPMMYDGACDEPPPQSTAGRLGSPIALTCNSSNVGLSNTFPRSLFPQGLDSISSLEQQRRATENEGTADDPFVGPSRHPWQHQADSTTPGQGPLTSQP